MSIHETSKLIVAGHKHVEAMRTAENKARVIDAIRDHGVIGKALEAARVPRQNYYRWVEEDGIFSDNVQRAFLESAEPIEATLRDIALNGIEEHVIYKGQLMYMRHPDTGELMMDPETHKPIELKQNKRNIRAMELFLELSHPRFRKNGTANNAPSIHIHSGQGANGSETKIEVAYVMPDNKNVEDYAEAQSKHTKVSNKDVIIEGEVSYTNVEEDDEGNEVDAAFAKTEIDEDDDDWLK